MFSIGDFAEHGRVSIRMLRHYDAIGCCASHANSTSRARGTRTSG